MKKVKFDTACPTCARPATAPWRVWGADGEITWGCVDHFHTGWIASPSASAAWHARPEARRARSAAKALRGGWVTERAP